MNGEVATKGEKEIEEMPLDAVSSYGVPGTFCVNARTPYTGGDRHDETDPLSSYADVLPTHDADIPRLRQSARLSRLLTRLLPGYDAEAEREEKVDLLYAVAWQLGLGRWE